MQDATRGEERIVWGACSVNCGSRCALRSHVRDDEVVWVETDNTGADIYGDHQVRACLRGRSIRRRINHPDRLNYPMKRVGKRGEGKFVRISWEEALDTIAGNLKRIVKDYGNEAVYINYSSGIVGGNMTRSSPTASPVMRLMNCYGGSLNQYGTYSTAQIACAMPYTYGSNDGNSTSDIENSKLVVMFGNNPAETRMSGGGITYYLEQARERSNARMIVIDPRYTDTAAGREDEWIPIRPGTDAALVAGGTCGDGIQEQELFDDRFFIYVSPDNPLYERSNVRIEDIDLRDLILLSDGNCMRDQVIELCQAKRGVPSHYYFESGSLDTLMRIVDCTQCVTIIPEMAVEYVPKEHRDRVKTLAKGATSRKIAIAVRRTFVKSSIIKALAESIRTYRK